MRRAFLPMLAVQALALAGTMAMAEPPDPDDRPKRPAKKHPEKKHTHAGEIARKARQQAKRAERKP